ncbi:MAG: hypothetical protein EXS22_07410 [Pedosphaera sp.]|nr:hypothetical protein [Pedosphaera sp.]
MKSRWKIWLAAVLLPLASCIDFDTQTLVYRHYPASDVLVMFQNYEGIHGAKKADGLAQKEIDQLTSVFEESRTFFFSNWILEFNAAKVRAELAQLRAGNNADIAPAIRKAKIVLLALLVENVAIQSGPFYLNAAGRPSGVQRITVRQISKIITAANVLLREEILAKPEPPVDVFDKALLEHARAKRDFIALNGQRLEVHLPASWNVIWATLNGENKTLLEFIPAVLAGGFEFDVRHNRVTVAAGRADANATTLRFSIPDSKYQPNAAGFLEEKYGLQKQFDPARAQREFFAESDRQYTKRTPAKP